MQLELSESQVASLRDITDSLTSEYAIKDNLQEEMLRILLKRSLFCAPGSHVRSFGKPGTGKGVRYGSPVLCIGR